MNFALQHSVNILGKHDYGPETWLSYTPFFTIRITQAKARGYYEYLGHTQDGSNMPGTQRSLVAEAVARVTIIFSKFN